MALQYNLEGPTILVKHALFITYIITISHMYSPLQLAIYVSPQQPLHFYWVIAYKMLNCSTISICSYLAI